MAALPIIPPRTIHQNAGGKAGDPLEVLARELASRIEGDVRFDFHNRMLYATDASLYQVAPLGVVIPASIDDAVRALEFCLERNLPILPRGGGTSLAGQCVNKAIVIDFSAACRAIRSVDVARSRCTVEAGTTIDELNRQLAPSGLFFAPDPATTRQANIGGCIGNNAAGARSIVYGRTSENLLGVEAAIPSDAGVKRASLDLGAASRDPFARNLTLKVAGIVRNNEILIRERFPKTIRRNAGYNLDLILKQMDSAGARADSDAVLESINLAHLVCGSEGTLAVTLAADLLLRPFPRGRALALVGLSSLEEAIDAVVPILSTGPSALELLDETVLDLARRNSECAPSLRLMPAPARSELKAVLYVEYSAGQDISEIQDGFARLREVLSSAAPLAGIANYADAPSIAFAWKLRTAGEPLLHGTAGDRKPISFVEDNAVPVEHLSQFVREFRRIVESRGTRAAFWAHASVGVLHVRPFLDVRDDGDRLRMREIAVEVADLARSLGGVMSGEHGDGRARGPLLERYYGPELMRAFRQVKAAFDPRNLLNPGNIVEPGPIASIAESLRVKPGARPVDALPVDTYFDYSDQHGLRGAAEMCNGAGVCRKRTGGTMCPSYMATLDERHSTRGRGNALRLAITGQLSASSEPIGSSTSDIPHPPSDIWSNPATIETLDLCLSCKACKSECPSNVDIARLKAEYTAQGYRSTGRIPLKARAFGHVRLLNRLGSAAPALANWANRQSWMRAFLDQALGLARKRSIPEFSRSLARQGVRRGPQSGAGAPVVGLFGDCFTMYNEPGIGLASRRVLEAFGYEVRLVNAGCCGRAMISTGLLPDAISAADRALDKLRPLVEDDRVHAILFAEPSCLSAIKDDWLNLKLRAPRALREQLARMSWLPEEFLDHRWKNHPRRPRWKESAGSVILHAHCHQKALWGAESSARLIRRLVGDRLDVLDSGCCGMAGSFGYEASHYDLSMKIGELALFPAVRRAAPGDTVLAPGTSCRHQIRDGTACRARHPIELVDSLISA